MKKEIQYIIIIILTFILYGNTLFHDYTLDDAIVITENEYTLNGFDRIDDLFKEKMFNGFFEQKDKNLVAGGRYRPLSVVTFAVEWELIMGSPFDGINELMLRKKMDLAARPKYILPSQKLLKELSNTIHIEDRKLRLQQQDIILNNVKVLTGQEKELIKRNLKRMHSKRKLLLFISHFLNVLLYSLTGIILFILLQNLLSDYEPKRWYLSIPFLASILFIAHPIHTEVIANIKGRDEIMSLLGALLACLLAVKYLKSRKSKFLVWGFIAFLGALFSKEVAVTFIVIIPLSIYFFSSNEQKTGKVIYSIVPLVLASAIYFYIRSKVIGNVSFEQSNELMNNSFLGMNFSERYATIFYTLLLYLKLLIFPHPLTYDYYPYHIPIMNWTDIWPVISVIAYMGIGIYALFGIRKKSLISFGILFYLIALSPMSNIFFPIGVFMNERFVYAASIGFIIILAYLISSKFPRWMEPKTVVILISVVFVLYSVKTVSRNAIWKNDLTLFTNDVKISENSAKSNTSAGGKLIEEAIKPKNKDVKQEYLDQSIFYLKRAVNIYPEYIDALLLLGNAEWEKYHDLDSTFKYYRLILEQNPRYDRVYTNIFETKLKQEFDKPENADKNIRVLSELNKYNSTHFYVNYYLGRIYGRYKNDLKKSVEYLEKAASINPDDVAVYKDLGVAYGLSKKYMSSANALSRAIELDRDDLTLRINLAMTYLNLRMTDKALEIMDSTFNMKFDQSSVNGLVNLAYLYRNLGQLQKTQQCFDKAKKINPDLFAND